MASAVHVLPLGRLRMRALHFSPLRDLCRSVTVTRSCTAALRHWRNAVLRSWDPLGAIMLRKVETTDASLTGWGIIQESRTLNCVWRSTLYSHINYLEFITVWKALKNVLPYLQGLHVLVGCDNTTAIWTARGNALLQASCTAHRLLVWSRWHFLSFRGDPCPGYSEQGRSPFVVGEPTLRRMAPPPSDSGTAMKEVWSGSRCSLRLMRKRPLFYVLLATGWGRPPPFGVDALAHPWPNVLL